MFQRFIRCLALPSVVQLRLLLAAVILLIVRAGVLVITFSQLRRVLLRVASRDVQRLGSPPPQHLSWAINVVDRHLPGTRTCLMRSLAAEALLHIHGYTPQHRIGVVKRDNGALEAHSWLEYEGVVVIGDVENSSRYEALPPI